MNLDRAYIFSCVEEDNIQRAYFRIHPLLTTEGDAAEEAHKLWPDNGCLRIVPDRAEQHTFKDRMRSMNGWCVVDLSAFAPEANKIRTNKNYHPDRGEVNQYILYSDAVRELPENIFYEVLTGSADDYAALAPKAVTPRFFIHSDDTLLGPVDRANPQKPEAAPEAEAVLYTVKAPDDSEHTVMCIASEFVPKALLQVQEDAGKDAEEPATPKAEEPKKKKEKVKRDEAKASPAAAEKKEEKAEKTEKTAAEEALPIGKSLQILDQQQTFEETLTNLNQPVSTGANLLKQSGNTATQQQPAAPLTGTPLTRTAMRTSIPQPKNRLQEVVSSQWRVVRNDPPCEPLPAGCAMKQIDNPVQDACEALRAAWSVPEAQTQLVNCILSLDGMTAKLEPHAVKTISNSPLQEAIQARLNDLEVERLAALVELDKAKNDLEDYRKNAVTSAIDKTKKELIQLEKNRDEMQKTVDALKEQINLMIAQRDELVKRIEELSAQEIPARVTQLFADCAVTVPVAPAALRMSPVSGGKVTLDEMTARIEKLCKLTNVPYVRNHAVALLAAMAVSGRVGLVSAAPAAAATFMRGLGSVMGWSSGMAQQVTVEQRPLLACKPVDNTPALLVTSLASYAPLADVCKLMLTRSTNLMVRNAAYETEQWPILPMGISQYVPEVNVTCDMPVSEASLKALTDGVRTTDEEIERVLAPVLAPVPPLSGRAKAEMCKFVAACTQWMDGGLAAACDWAIMMWVLPGLERNARNVNEMKALLAEYPLSTQLLGN